MRDVLRFLGSLWGVLTSASILFRGAAALLKLPLAPSESRLSGYYGLLPSIVAAFALLLLGTYRDRLRERAVARRLAVCSFVMAIAPLFGFIAVKQLIVDLDQVERPVWNGVELTQVMRKRRMVRETTVNPETKAIVTEVERGDPRDVYLLLLLTLTFCSLTVAFGSLGVHVYERELNGQSA